MKESYGEGVATHAGPESCVAVRKVGVEALTGESAGWPLSREIHAPPVNRRVLRGADVLETDGRPHRMRRYRKADSDPARSETPRMHGRTLRGNREIPQPSARRGSADRIGKSKDVRR